MRCDPLIELPDALTLAKHDPDARYVMGVDGGATKTLAAVMDIHRGVVRLGHGGPSNPDAVGSQAAGRALLAASAGALQQMGIGIERLDAVVLAMAGTDTTAIEELVQPGGPLAQAGGWPSNEAEPWVVVNDVVGAWAAATAGREGVAIISGTGSNVFGVGPGARPWRSGGWGHVLGDEGSSYWLALSSIKAALHERDGTGVPTALSDAVTRFFGMGSVEDVAALLYAKPLTKGEVAAFAVETARAALAGDSVARELYQRAAADLAEQANTVIRHTCLTGDFPVGLIGGAFKAGPLLVTPLEEAIHSLAPHARVSTVTMPPVGGCLVLAARIAGCQDTLDTEMLEQALAAARPATG